MIIMSLILMRNIVIRNIIMMIIQKKETKKETKKDTIPDEYHIKFDVKLNMIVELYQKGDNIVGEVIALKNNECKIHSKDDKNYYVPLNNGKNIKWLREIK